SCAAVCGCLPGCSSLLAVLFCNDSATSEFYTLSLHDALPIFGVFVVGLPRTLAGAEGKPAQRARRFAAALRQCTGRRVVLLDERSEEHTSELQSRENLVCRLLLEKKKNNQMKTLTIS